MINLLPLQEKKEIEAEYSYRRIILVLWFLCALLLGITLLLGVFAAVLGMNNVEIEQAIAHVRERITKGETAGVEDSIRLVNAKIEAVLPRVDVSSVTSAILISRLESVVSKGVTIESLGYAEGTSPEGVSSVSLTGVARDRETLLAFVRALSEDPLFVTVDSPISNLVRPEHLSFQISAKVRALRP